MAGFRRPEVPRGQLVLWSHRLDDAIPADHPVRHFASLLGAEAFAETFAAWERGYVLVEGKPPYHPRDLSGLYRYGMMNRIREQPESPDQSPERKRAGRPENETADGRRWPDHRARHEPRNLDQTIFGCGFREGLGWPDSYAG